MTPPCVIFEDEHLLVVNKPAGWNTHAPAPFASEGIYDWLRHREPRWANLAIVHRLDKETSGVLVFGKTTLANKSLSEQFEQRTVGKRYLLVSDRPPAKAELSVRSNIAREGNRYVGLPKGAGGEPAETRFKCEMWNMECGTWEVTAEPVTGRTHQIRVHAAASGFPILGDTLYGGTPAPRVLLHALEIRFKHPGSGAPVSFKAPPGFAADPRRALREAAINFSCRAPSHGPFPPMEKRRDEATAGEAPLTQQKVFSNARTKLKGRGGETAKVNAAPEIITAYRLIHRAADGWPGWNVERLGDFLLSQSEATLTEAQSAKLSALSQELSSRGVFHKRLDRRVRQSTTEQASPQLILGAPAPDRFTVCENGLTFELSFTEGYSYGLFLDQRDNRRRLLTGYLAADFERSSEVRGARHEKESRSTSALITHVTSQPTLLNCFSYTCAFSVAAARAGYHTTSLDLSKKYLDWGRRNFALNDLDDAAHDFIFGDVFDWLRRLAKKNRRFDTVLLDPPTFSQSKASGIFRAEKDYEKLVLLALPLLRENGILFASTNCATLPPENFLASLSSAVHKAGRRIVQQHYVPQPLDFPISHDEPAYLKTVWLRVG